MKLAIMPVYEQFAGVNMRILVRNIIPNTAGDSSLWMSHLTEYLPYIAETSRGRQELCKGGVPQWLIENACEVCGMGYDSDVYVMY